MYTTASQVYELAEREFSMRYAHGIEFDEKSIESFLHFAFKQHVFSPKLEENREKLWRRVWKRLYWRHPEWDEVRPTHHTFVCEFLPSPYKHC